MLDIVNRENLIYIIKFILSLRIAQHINFYQIIDNIYIDNSIITLDIELNL